MNGIAGFDAHISDCEDYRYFLSRDIDGVLGPPLTCVFVMLNPSTADALENDATIRRCIGFCKRWGYSKLVVVNLYAYRTTNPNGLWTHPTPAGPENDNWLRKYLQPANRIVCAWGTNAKQTDVDRFMALAADTGTPLWCLKEN